MKFGGIPGVAKNSTVYKLPIHHPNDLVWQLEVKDVGYGNYSICNSTCTSYAEIDFSTNDLFLPETYFDIIADKLDGIGFQKDDSKVLISNETCEALYPLMGNFVIQFGQFRFFIPPEGYTLQGEKHCFVEIYFWDNEYYRIGKELLVNYFITFDYGDNTIEFRLRPDAPDAPDVQEMVHIWPYWGITLASTTFVVTSFIIGIWAYFTFCTKKKRAARKEMKEERKRVEE